MSALLTVLLSFCLYSHITAEECSGNVIRMTNGRVTIDRDTYSMAGGIQICVNNRWATVCQSGWEDVDATVACEQLGLSYAGCKFLDLYSQISSGRWTCNYSLLWVVLNSLHLSEYLFLLMRD